MTQPTHHSRPLIFGEVLFDCFPDGNRVLGGAPFNVARHLHGFGLSPHFVSALGTDANGDAVLATMRDWGMDSSGVQRDPHHPTGQVTVSLADGQPSYAILPDQAYDYVTAPQAPPDIALIYHGSLALRRQASRSTFAGLQVASAAPVFVDVNLRDPWWDAASVSTMLDGARWCKLNDLELASLSGPDDPVAAAQRLIQRHGLDLVFVTLGAAGAMALGADGASHRIAPAGDVKVVDTVGAGDAFASVLIAGLLLGWPVPQTLERAQRLASVICGLRGALPSDAGLYAALLADWVDR
jgi:fructokinase